MGSPAYDELLGKLKRSAGSTRVRIDDSVVPVLGVINRLLGVGGVKITKASIDAGTDTSTVSGRLSLVGVPADVALTLTDGTPLAVDFSAALNDDVSLMRTVTAMGGPLSALATQLLSVTGASKAGADIVLSAATISATNVNEQVTITGTTTAPVGIKLADAAISTQLGVELTSALADDGTGTRTADVTARGAVTMGPAEVAIAVSVTSEGNTLTGSWSAGDDDEQLDLLDVFTSMGLPSPDVPAELAVGLTALEIAWNAGTQSLNVDASTDGFGSVAITAEKAASGRWDHSISYELEPGAGPADFPDMVGDLSDLGEFTFERLAVVYASRDGAPSAGTIVGAPPKLERGVNAVAVIDLYDGSDEPDESSENATLAGLAGARRVTVVASTDGSGVTLRAQLDGMVDVGGGLQLGDAFVQMVSSPPTLSLGGTLRADLGEQVLFADGGISVSLTQINGTLVARTETPAGEPANMLEPLGIRGVGLSEIGLGLGVMFAPPSVTMGMAAKFSIGADQQPDANEFAVVLQVIPSAPVPVVNLLVAQFALEQLSLARMMSVFVDEPPALPAVIGELEARNLGFHYAQRPTPLPDGTIAAMGFGFHGEIDIFGLSARAVVMIDPKTGARGRFEMAPVDIKVGDVSILRVTRAVNPLADLNAGTSTSAALTEGPTSTSKKLSTYSGGPVFEFNSSGPKFLFANCEVELFGLFRSSVVAEVSTDGLTYVVEQAISDVLTITMGCSVTTGTSPRFQAKAAFDFDLDVEIPVVIGQLDLGTISLDTELHASLTIDASAERFSLIVDGDFEFEGTKFDFPRLELNIPLASFTDLAKRIIDRILEKAGELFEDLFNAIKDLWDGAVAAIEAGAKALAEAAEQLALEAKELAEDIVEGAEQAVAAIGEGLEVAGEAVAELANDAAEVLEQGRAAVAAVTEDITDFAVGVSVEVERVAEEAKQFVSDVVAEAEEFIADVGKNIEQLADAVDKAVAALIDDAEEVAAAALQAALTLANDIAAEAERLAKALEREFAALARELEQVLEDIAEFFEDVGDEILSWF